MGGRAAGVDAGCGDGFETRQFGNVVAGMGLPLAPSLRRGDFWVRSHIGEEGLRWDDGGCGLALGRRGWQGFGHPPAFASLRVPLRFAKGGYPPVYVWVAAFAGVPLGASE